MHNLIYKKFTVTCDLLNLDCANYLDNNFLSMFFTPKHLNLFACGMPSGDFANSPLEGYRTLIPNKITQTTHNQKPTGQGGARKAGL